MASINQTIIQAKVTLQDIEPPIWRRLLLPPTLNLAELHHVLQAAFGWRVPDLRFLYHYDFGDSWLHLVAFEQRITKDTGLKYPACVDGARHRPLEDVGGTSGYVQFLEAWSDPTHEEHTAMRQWAGRAFHPEKFDLQATDKAVKTACRRARGDYVFRRQ